MIGSPAVHCDCSEYLVLVVILELEGTRGRVMRTRLMSVLLALALAFGVSMPAVAWADDAEAEGASGAESISVSADGLTAVLDGCEFTLGDFQRANAGSNREIDGAYYGYAYLVGSKPSDVMYIVTESSVVVYVNQEAAVSAGVDLQESEDVEALKQIIIVLDAANARGNAGIKDAAAWTFTSEREIEVAGVAYTFDREIDGNRYDLVIGSDGSDVTDTSSAHYGKPTHACFASLIASGEAVMAEEPSWFESLGAFMGRLDWSPLFVTLRTTLTAIVFIFVLGLAAAYLCLNVSPRARDIFDTIFTIPMVLPPTVCGFLLLLALGNNTALGRWFISIGFPLIFSWPATVIAAVVVAFPLMYRNARGAFENLDPNMLDAARTLGWSEARIFFKIMLPLSWSSIAAGTVLAFARALGEFGATLFLAGNYLGVTRTIPIAIYFEWMNGNIDVALFWTVVILIFSFIVILFINLWSQHTTRYRKGAVEE